MLLQKTATTRNKLGTAGGLPFPGSQLFFLWVGRWATALTRWASLDCQEFVVVSSGGRRSQTTLQSIMINYEKALESSWTGHDRPDSVCEIHITLLSLIGQQFTFGGDCWSGNNLLPKDSQQSYIQVSIIFQSLNSSTFQMLWIPLASWKFALGCTKETVCLSHVQVANAMSQSGHEIPKKVFWIGFVPAPVPIIVWLYPMAT